MRARISEVGLRQLARYVMPFCGLLIRCALSSDESRSQWINFTHIA